MIKINIKKVIKYTLKNVIKYALIVSGILFWVFIVMTFVHVGNALIFDFVYWFGIYFWMYIMPFELSAMVFVVMIFIVSILIERNINKIKKKLEGEK